VTYYMMVRGQRIGPLNKEQLLGEGLEHDSLVWFQGAADWLRAREVPDLRDLLATIPPPPPQTSNKWEDAGGPNLGHFPRPVARYTPWTFRALYGWFLGLFLLSIAFFFLMIVFLVLYENQRVWRPNNPWGASRNPVWEVLAVFAGLFAGPPLIAAAVVFFIAIYKMWDMIQDGRAEATPPAAVGLWFVPFFNLYWIFVAYYGLERNMNDFCRRHGIRARPAPAGLALATCVIAVIPYVNAVAPFFFLVSMGFFKTTAADIAQALQRHDPRAAEEW
jgi:hypothetical protein